MSLLSPSQVKETFPWMNTAGVALASHGEFISVQSGQNLAAVLLSLSSHSSFGNWMGTSGR